MEVKKHRWTDLEAEPLAEGIRRRMLNGEKLMLAEIELDRGAVVPTHSHHNEQVSHVIEGRLRFVCGENDDVVELKAGEVLVIPSNVPHSAEALSDCRVIDSFSPPREDWLSGNDDYLRGK